MTNHTSTSAPTEVDQVDILDEVAVRMKDEFPEYPCGLDFGHDAFTVYVRVFNVPDEERKVVKDVIEDLEIFINRQWGGSCSYCLLSMVKSPEITARFYAKEVEELSR